MKKILIGFIAIGLLTFVGCEKDDDTDTETTDSTETSSDDGSKDSTETSSDDGSTDTSDDTKDTSSDDGSTDSDDEGTETDSDDETTDSTSSIEYGEVVTDVDGNTYQSVIIGNQEWMSENLRTTKYSDGIAIPNLTDDTEWANDTTGSWCHYENNSDYDDTYGKLYNWYAVETEKLCPIGWHVPTDEDWTVLTDYLGANGYSVSQAIALKSTSDWNSDGNGTDAYGWLALPGGGRWGSSFSGIGSGNWWSSSDNSPGHAWLRYMESSSDTVARGDGYKWDDFSVRCLRD